MFFKVPLFIFRILWHGGDILECTTRKESVFHTVFLFHPLDQVNAREFLRISCRFPYFFLPDIDPICWRHLSQWAFIIPASPLPYRWQHTYFFFSVSNFIRPGTLVRWVCGSVASDANAFCVLDFTSSSNGILWREGYTVFFFGVFAEAVEIIWCWAIKIFATVKLNGFFFF